VVFGMKVFADKKEKIRKKAIKDKLRQLKKQLKDSQNWKKENCQDIDAAARPLAV